MKTHQAKIAVTRRDMTPDYEREAQRDRDRLQSARTPESEPAPSKAKSSPLPWHSVYARMEALESELVQAAIDEQKLKAHADKLAEACRAYVRARNDGGISMADYSTIADTAIREALANYEAAQ